MERYVTIITALLVVGCGADGVGGDAGVGGEGGVGGTGGVGGAGGATGTGGDGGVGGAGGFGGFPDPEPKACDTIEDCEFGLLCSRISGDDNCVLPGTPVECDFITEYDGRALEGVIHYREEWVHIPTEPGEVLILTLCDHNDFVDGVEVEPYFTGECITFEVTADDDTYEEFCGALVDATDAPGARNWTTYEYGFRETYVRRK